MSSDTLDESVEIPVKDQKVNEFNDGRKRPTYLWKHSFSDWWKHSWSGEYSDEKVESRLLSALPFWPASDGKRKAEMINTDIGNGNFIHEFFVENVEKPAASDDSVKDVVLVHGYAASLGLFIDNFDSLTSIPGIRLHSIDLLGFGLSSRPAFPKFPALTKQEIYKVEDWFIDSLEEWRKKRGIERFVLVGHSFGGYLSCAYVMKYNKNLIDAATGRNQRLVDKLVLVSPVGVERSKFSLLKDTEPPSGQVSTGERSRANLSAPAVHLSQEVNADQETIIQGHEVKPEEEAEEPKTRRRRFIDYLWRQNVSPFSVVRKMGPVRSKMISLWTTHRFAHVYFTNPEQFQNLHDYFYRVFNAVGSGEYAITRVLDVGALAKLPLLDRCPEKFVRMGLPTLWIYGDKDWMNEQAGLEMTKEINKLSTTGDLASFSILKNAGHHLYLDNPPDFAKVIFKFLNFRR